MNAYTDIITKSMLAAYPSAEAKASWGIYTTEDREEATEFSLVMYPGTLKFNPVNAAGDLGAVFFFEWKYNMPCPVHDLLDLQIENYHQDVVEHVVLCNTETKD
jgi:hypothetical protein